MIADIPPQFWTITIGTIIQIVTLAMAVGGMVWKLGSATTELKENTKETRALNHKVEELDKGGTTFSRLHIQAETELTKSNTAQIQMLTEAQLKIGPEIAGIKADLDWIKNSMMLSTVPKSRRRS